MRQIRVALLSVLTVFCGCAGWFNEPSHPDNPLSPRPFDHRGQEEKLVKKRVLILKFLNKTTFASEGLQESIYHDIRFAVSKEPDLVPVPEEELDGHEDFMVEDAYYNMRVIFEKARGSGISAIVGGSIEELSIEEKGDEIGFFRTRYHTSVAAVRFQLFDVASEKELVAKTNTGEVTEEFTSFLGGRALGEEDPRRGIGAISIALGKSLARFPEYAKRIGWLGRIAKIDLHRYYINAGEATGISRGQLLKVFGEGSQVLDKQLGTFLGMAPGRFKGLLKVVDHFGRDGSVAIVHSGGGFREQDRVEVFAPPPK